MITRSEILRRARSWLTPPVPYSMVRYVQHVDPAPPVGGWRTDCSGFVSMAWMLPTSRWTGNLAAVATRIDLDELAPGDMLLYHNPGNPHSGSHVVLFLRWVTVPGADFWIVEQTPPHTREIRWSSTRRRNLSSYKPYRYNGLAPDRTEGDDDMRGVMGQLRDESKPNGVRLTVFYGTTGNGSMRPLRREESVDVLREAGALFEVFEDAEAMADTLGWLPGDLDGSKTTAAIRAAG